jgi:histidinol phosphatase-like PHP family hydrolase
MTDIELTNGDLAELLARSAENEEGHRVRALRRASRAAMFWPDEAADLAERGRSLTELRSVGPWVERLLVGWLESPPNDLGRPELRSGFLTRSQARRTIAENPGWTDGLRSDLQMHTTDSDGNATLLEMLQAARGSGHRYVAFTDHSKGLPIANGMDEERLRAQAETLGEANAAVAAEGGAPITGLQGIEMNLSPEGEGDMDPAALGELDIVLGAFHSKLRLKEDQTERYLAAVANPDVQVLAHPRGRMYGRRLGLSADWPRVFAAASERGKALEADAHPARQDLDVDRLEIARDAGAWISIDTDAHAPSELEYQEFGIAAAIRAGIPRERVLNFLSEEELREWVSVSRERAKR